MLSTPHEVLRSAIIRKAARETPKDPPGLKLDQEKAQQEATSLKPDFYSSTAKKTQMLYLDRGNITQHESLHQFNLQCLDAELQRVGQAIPKSVREEKPYLSDLLASDRSHFTHQMYLSEIEDLEKLVPPDYM